MNSLDEDSSIPVINLQEGDIGVLFGAPLAGLLIGGLLGFELLAVGLLFVGLTIGVAVVYAAPPHLTAWDWLTDVSRYLYRPRATRNYRTADANDSTEGGLVEYTPFSIDESTQQLTNVQRAWPGANAIERTDGTMEAFLEVTPSNMDFAMSDDWAAVQRAGEEFANNELEFSLTIHTTTQSFPVERLIEQLDDRLDDPDVEANPVFGDLISEYQRERPTELTDTKEIRYYLGVEASRVDVYQQYDAEPTPVEKLREFPIVGILFAPFVTGREQLSEAEVRKAMFDTLDRRIEVVETELVDDISGWSSRRMSTTELFVLLVEFWNGEEHPADADRLLRKQPAVGRQPRGDRK